MTTWNRREVMAAAAAMGLMPGVALPASETMLTRAIPSSGEALPVIGLGTYSVFDVGGSDEEIATRKAIVEMLYDKGGSLIDTSPMYNRSEKVIGDVFAAGAPRSDCFVATKVWIDGEAAGIRQMNESAELMRTEIIDLMQVHNLRDTAIHMKTIREWQEAGRIRYNGLTHYTAGAHEAMAAAMKQYQPEFIQINYSLGERESHDRLLPMAADMGIAVIANRPFQSGRLFAAVRGKAVPEWAAGFAASWGQFFLKYIVSHPAITNVIPATSKTHHMEDNLMAGYGEMPDAKMRQRMEQFVDAL